MFGYIIETNYEYLGWGQLYRFTEFSGAYNVAESWFVTVNSMIYDLVNKTPGVYDQTMMTEFLDNTVVYGDPKAIAYMDDLGDSAAPYLEKFLHVAGSGGIDTFEYTATEHLAGGVSGGTNFYYGQRPFRYLPVRIDPSSVVIQKNDGHGAAITRSFMLWSMLEGSSESLAKGASKTLRWTARAVDQLASAAHPVTGAPAEKFWCNVRPLDGKGIVEITYGGIRNSTTDVRIVNAEGTLITSAASSLQRQGDQQSILLSVKNPARGVYYAAVKCGSKRMCVPLILVK